jgi:hypothetical protein
MKDNEETSPPRTSITPVDLSKSVNRQGNVACITWVKNRGVMYREGFRRLAGIGVEYIMGERRNRREEDILVYPILYCFRHDLELTLKEIIYSASYLQDRKEPKLRKLHDLSYLWNRARPLINAVYEGHDTTALEPLAQIIAQLHEMDPGGESFRYSHHFGADLTLKVKRGNGDVNEYIAIDTVALVMKDAHALLRGITEGISVYVEQKQQAQGRYAQWIEEGVYYPKHVKPARQKFVGRKVIDCRHCRLTAARGLRNLTG